MVLLSQMIREARATLPRPLPIQTIGSTWDMNVYAGVDAQGNPIDATVSIVDVPDGSGGTMKALSVIVTPVV